MNSCRIGDLIHIQSYTPVAVVQLLGRNAGILVLQAGLLQIEIAQIVAAVLIQAEADLIFAACGRYDHIEGNHIISSCFREVNRLILTSHDFLTAIGYRYLDLGDLIQQLDLVEITAGRGICATDKEQINVGSGSAVGNIQLRQIKDHTDIAVVQLLNIHALILILDAIGIQIVVTIEVRPVRQQSNANLLTFGDLVLQAQTGSGLGLIQILLEVHTGSKCLATDEAFLTGSDLSCAVGGNIQLLQLGQQRFTIIIMDADCIGVAVAIGVDGLAGIDAGHDDTFVQTLGISRNIRDAKLIFQHPHVFVIFKGLTDVLQTDSADRTIDTVCRTGINQHAVTGSAVVAITGPVAELGDRTIIIILAPVVHSGVQHAIDVIVIHHPAGCTRGNQGAIDMIGGERLCGEAATIPPQLFFIGVIITLVCGVQILELRAVECTAGQLRAAHILPHLVIGSIIGMLRSDHGLQRHKAGLQLGISVQLGSQSVLHLVQLCSHGICISIFTGIFRLVIECKICLLEHVCTAAGLCQFNVLVDHCGQCSGQCGLVDRAVAISFKMQAVRRDFGSYCQIAGSVFHKGVIPTGNIPGIHGHDTLAYQVLKIGICQVSVDGALACLQLIPPNGEHRFYVNFLGHCHVINVDRYRNLHGSTVDGQGCKARVSTGGCILYIQIDPQATVLACGNLVLAGSNGCILGNQRIREHAAGTLTGFATSGLEHIGAANPAVLCPVGSIACAADGHIVLGIDLKCPTGNDVALFVLQTIHGQFERGHIKIGSQDHLRRLRFVSCAFKRQRIETVRDIASLLNHFRIVGVRNAESVHSIGQVSNRCRFIGKYSHGDHTQNHDQCQQNRQNALKILLHGVTS